MKQMKDISKIIARKLLNSKQHDDDAICDQWEQTTKDNTTFLHLMSDFWRVQPKVEKLDRQEELRERLKVRLTASSRLEYTGKVIRLTWSRIAVAAIFIGVIIFSSVYFTKQMMPVKEDSFFQIATDAGQRTQMTLPDGSKVWLNAQTNLLYKEDKNTRQVTLEGEAYFEVKHAADFPFEVETGNGKVKVTGTKFMVSHYQGSAITEASLLSGKIKFAFPGGEKEVDVAPGERIVFNANLKSYTQKTYDVKTKILWREGILVFDKEAFSMLIDKLERYYAVTIDYPEDKFKNIHYTGTINNLRLESLMEFISLTIPMDYEIKNRRVIIR
ncbi:DUF4974 domain-containing protein [Prolixibacteraceae bacterium JC049]|nr:DUF4974 domain-containing protein [Prolixibacteraceae bacterium JC049]